MATGCFRCRSTRCPEVKITANELEFRAARRAGSGHSWCLRALACGNAVFSVAGGSGMRSAAHARGARTSVSQRDLVNVVQAWHRPACREWGLRPPARTACPLGAEAPAVVRRCFARAFGPVRRLRWLQGGGGACGRRPHSRHACRRCAWPVFGPPPRVRRSDAPRAWAAERGRRQRPAAAAPWVGEKLRSAATHARPVSERIGADPSQALHASRGAQSAVEELK